MQEAIRTAVQVAVETALDDPSSMSESTINHIIVAAGEVGVSDALIVRLVNSIERI